MQYRAKRVDFLRYSIPSSSRRRCGSGSGRFSGSGSCSGREYASGAEANSSSCFCGPRCSRAVSRCGRSAKAPAVNPGPNV